MRKQKIFEAVSKSFNSFIDTDCADENKCWEYISEEDFEETKDNITKAVMELFEKKKAELKADILILIGREVSICHKEETSTSRLTSLFNAIYDI